MTSLSSQPRLAVWHSSGGLREAHTAFRAGRNTRWFNVCGVRASNLSVSCQPSNGQPALADPWIDAAPKLVGGPEVQDCNSAPPADEPPGISGPETRLFHSSAVASLQRCDFRRVVAAPARPHRQRKVSLLGTLRLQSQIRKLPYSVTRNSSRQK